MRPNDPDLPVRPDHEPIDDLDELDEVDEIDDDVDDDLTGLDKTLADSFPASDPPQAP